VKRWAAAQEERPGRSEAIRRLLNQALAVTPKRSKMRISVETVRKERPTPTRWSADEGIGSTSGVPQIADDPVTSPNSAALGHWTKLLAR
jgi:hypothetical protein